FWNDLSARHSLQPIVADRGRSVQPFIGVAGFEQASCCGVVSPDTRETISLQLQPNRQCVRLTVVRSFTSGGDRLGDTQQVLHVVPDFMRHDVRLREVAGSAKPFLEFAEKREVEVDLAIGGAVERSNLRPAEAARGLSGAVEQHEHWRHVRLPALTEYVAPR